MPLRPLPAVGFRDTHAWLEPASSTSLNGERSGAVSGTVALGPYLAALPEDLHDACIAVMVAVDARHGVGRTSITCA